jgi:hypothetical protein
LREIVLNLGDVVKIIFAGQLQVYRIRIPGFEPLGVCDYYGDDASSE